MISVDDDSGDDLAFDDDEEKSIYRMMFERACDMIVTAEDDEER